MEEVQGSTDQASTSTADGAEEEVNAGWFDTWEHVREAAARLERNVRLRNVPSSDRLVIELLAAADSGDPLLVFLAIQALGDSLVHIQDRLLADDCMRRILLCSPPHAAGGAARLQLVRSLVKAAAKPSQSSRHPDLSGDEEEEEVDDDASGAHPNVHRWYLDSVLRSISSFEQLVIAALKHHSSHHSVHETLSCLAVVVKRAESRTMHGQDLCRIVTRVIRHGCTWNFGDRSMPTYIACDLIDLLMDARTLDWCTCPASVPPNYDAWAAVATSLLTSPLSTLCMDLFKKRSDESDGLSANAFVKKSSHYPMLQKWIQLSCAVATQTLTSATNLPEWSDTDRERLPSRAALVAVLTEQDDILLDVVFELLGIVRLVSNGKCNVTSVFKDYVTCELNPDLLFSDLLRVFGDDYLVLLDMLTSSETRILEYLTQYARYAASLWPQSRQTWDKHGRTNAVMSTLVRVRLEIERQVEANVFPYNPALMLRRIELLESLYEGDNSRLESSEVKDDTK